MLIFGYILVVLQPSKRLRKNCARRNF